MCCCSKSSSQKKYGIEKKLLTKRRVFKYDTGAQITCLRAEELDIDISEQEFVDNFNSIRVEGHGIDDASKPVVYYMIQVENFVVSGIDLGSVPIYITFDERVTKSLLGLDLIKLMNTEFNFDTKEITLSKRQALIDFHKIKLRLELADMFKMGIYSIDDGNKDIDWQSLLYYCSDTEIQDTIDIVDANGNKLTDEEIAK